MKKMTAMKAGWLYAFVHFSVEVACFFLLYTHLKQSDYWWAYALIFDALAFLPQSLFGVLSDKHPKFPYGVVGCVLVIIALVFPNQVVGMFIIGVGNALVHIDGAQHTLRNNAGKMTPNAVFVAGGSFGVIAGQLLGRERIAILWILPCLLMVISAVISYLVYRNHETKLEPETHIPLKITTESKAIPVMFLVLLAVAIRSFVAYAIPTDWNKTHLQAVALFSFMGVGKALGGMLADKIGFRKTTYLSLLLALPFLLFGNSMMWLSLVGVMLFSMTMPITVGMLCSKFPKAPGLAFGITTVGLFLGLFPKFFMEIDGLLTHQIITAVACVTALICILLCLKKEKKDVA